MSDAMQVLMLCHRPPYPPTKGEKIRALHHVRALRSRHSVTLATLADDARDVQHLPALRALAGDVHVVEIDARLARLRALTALAGSGSVSVRYFRSARFRTLVDRLLAERSYDVILVYSSAMAQYVEHVRHIPVVIDMVDMDSEKYRQYADHARVPISWLYRLESARLRRWEAHVGRHARKNVFVSSAEAALFRTAAGDAAATVLPMIIDTDYFAPEAEPAEVAPPTLVFAGVMDYRPNVDAVLYFVEQILPRIRREIADTRLLVVGQRPSRAVRQLARLRGIEVTGPVADVRPFLRRAQVSIAPFRMAQGVQTKVLQAMAMERPVVLTPPAHRGLAAQPGVHLLVEDTPQRFADAVVTLLRDHGLRRRLGAEGRRFVERHHAPDSAADHLLDTLQSVTDRRAPVRVGEHA